MKIACFLTAAVLILCISPSANFIQFQREGIGALSLVGPARAEESWKQEFEEVCGKTDDSMNMTIDELKALMARCDKLKPLIESQEETTRKVYLKRLQMCRDLLAFIYEAKSRH
jgi:hypothetical protein